MKKTWTKAMREEKKRLKLKYPMWQESQINEYVHKMDTMTEDEKNTLFKTVEGMENAYHSPEDRTYEYSDKDSESSEQPTDIDIEGMESLIIDSYKSMLDRGIETKNKISAFIIRLQALNAIPEKCPICGNVLDKKSGAKYCSNKCRQKDYRNRNKA